MAPMVWWGWSSVMISSTFGLSARAVVPIRRGRGRRR
jgi:hypothetical protein